MRLLKEESPCRCGEHSRPPGGSCAGGWSHKQPSCAVQGCELSILHRDGRRHIFRNIFSVINSMCISTSSTFENCTPYLLQKRASNYRGLKEILWDLFYYYMHEMQEIVEQIKDKDPKFGNKALCELLIKEFSFRRVYMNKNKKIMHRIKEKWPKLRSQFCLFIHFLSFDQESI